MPLPARTPRILAVVGVALTLATGAVPGATTPAGAAVASPSTTATPAPTLADAGARATDARVTRERAQARYDDLRARRAALAAKLGATSATSRELARRIDRARKKARDQAVAAFVSGGSVERMSVVLSAGAAADATSSMDLLAQSSDGAADAAAEYQHLKSTSDPALVALGDELSHVDDEVAQALSDLDQASALEADAEHNLARAQQAAARAAARPAAVPTTAPRVAGTTGSTAAPSSAPTAATASGVSAAAPTTGVTAPPSLPGAPTSTAPGTPSSTAPVAVTPTPAADAGSASGTDEWAQLRQCESGGNYAAVSLSGRYRGAYQFDQQTWEAVGGTGDPAAATPAEQDLRAKLLFARRGSRAWPVCGANLH